MRKFIEKFVFKNNQHDIRLFEKSGNNDSSDHVSNSSLTLDIIPRHSLNSMKALELQQEVHGIENKSIKYLSDRYADTLWEIFNALPLSDEEIERLILPIICNLYEYLHLIPASEYHHHSHIGGLIQHTLEVSANCAGLAVESQFPKPVSSRRRYDEQPKWTTAAAVMGLIHDCGKIFDVECSDESGVRIWNPHQQPLRSWLNSEHLSKYFVKWRPERTHGSHERRSIRLAYLHILPKEIERYFGSWPDSLLMNAVEDAIIMRSGPLSDILGTAEALSVNVDRSRRPHTFSSVNTIPVPSVRSVAVAVNELLRSGTWTVNSNGSPLWLGTSGLFLLISPKTLSDIRNMAGVFGNTNIPASADGFVQALAASGMLKPTNPDDPDSLLWHIKHERTSETLAPCICLEDLGIFFQGRPVPEPAALTCSPFDGKGFKSDPGSPQTLKTNDSGCHGLLAPKSSFIGEQSDKPKSGEKNADTTATQRGNAPEEHSSDAGTSPSKPPVLQSEELKNTADQLSNTELKFVSATAMSTPEAKIFLDRLISTLILHMKNGGQLAPNRRIDSGVISCSTVQTLIVLKNRKLDEISFKSMIMVRREEPRLCLDEKEQLFILYQ